MHNHPLLRPGPPVFHVAIARQGRKQIAQIKQIGRTEPRGVDMARSHGGPDKASAGSVAWLRYHLREICMMRGRIDAIRSLLPLQ